MKKVYYTWKDVEHMITVINNLMFVDGWRPDYIVGLTRGGLCPAVMLSNATGIPMHTLDVRFRDTSREYTGPESNLWMAEDAFAGKKILVIDDINDSGKTIDWIMKDWPSGCHSGNPVWTDSVWGGTTRFATLIDNQSSGFNEIDYTALEINKADEDVWVVFPWEGERNYGIV